MVVQHSLTVHFFVELEKIPTRRQSRKFPTEIFSVLKIMISPSKCLHFLPKQAPQKFSTGSKIPHWIRRHVAKQKTIGEIGADNPRVCSQPPLAVVRETEHYGTTSLTLWGPPAVSLARWGPPAQGLGQSAQGSGHTIPVQ